ncbi:MAG: hypothetical protein K8R39_05900 [Arcobacteraceae bacterium]|nr:hypothetical protein [Arcobacteraceae bacterium]
MDNRYYTVISRDEFINLYRYGNININISFIILNGDNIENEIIGLLNIMPFSQEEDYLIVEFEDENCCIGNSFEIIKTIYNLEIKKLKNIYVLTKKAQYFYSTKFDQRINFKIIPYKNILNEVIQFSELKDMDNGIDILFEQYGITNKKEIELGIDINLKKDFLVIDNYLETDFKNIFLDLLFYKRENKFVKEDVGYIFDLIIITLLKERTNEVINRFKQGELKLNNSATYNELQKSRQNTLYEHITFIEKSNDSNIRKFVNKIGISSLIIGSIYLKIKYLLLNKNKSYNEEIEQIINDFKIKHIKEIGFALYLVGCVFGYKKLYDDYYDSIGLDIFYKKYEVISNNIPSNIKKESDINKKKVHSNQKEKKQIINNSLTVLELTNDEVKKLSLTKLKEMAKERGYNKGLSKFKSNDEDKLKLYNEIKNYKSVFNI